MMVAIIILLLSFWFSSPFFLFLLAFLTTLSPISPSPHPYKVHFFTDLLESISFSLPLLAQLQTAAMSLKKTNKQTKHFKIGNIKKKKKVRWTQAVFWKWTLWRTHRAEIKSASPVPARRQKKKLQRSPGSQKPRKAFLMKVGGERGTSQEVKSQQNWWRCLLLSVTVSPSARHKVNLTFPIKQLCLNSVLLWGSSYSSFNRYLALTLLVKMTDHLH